MKLIQNTVYGGTWVPDHCNDKGPIIWNADNYAGGMIHDVVRLVPGRRRQIAIDLGANVGLTALGMGHYFENVIAVEADPLTFECLVKNTEINPNIQCYNYAISNIDADMSFTRVIGVSGHSHQYRGREGDKYETFNVPARKLSHLMQSIGKIRKPIGFIKMDIEGMEPLIIEDSLDLIRGHRPVLLIEIAHNYFESFDRIFTALKSIDFAFAGQIPNKRDFIFVHRSMKRRFELYRKEAYREKGKISSYPIIR